MIQSVLVGLNIKKTKTIKKKLQVSWSIYYAHPLSGVFKKVLQLYINSSVALCKTIETLIGKYHSDRLLSICGRRKKQRTIQEHFEGLNDVESTHYPEIGHWVNFVRSATVCDFNLY